MIANEYQIQYRKGSGWFFVIASIDWIALQISRAIAIPLINEVQAGGESNAWLFPAYLDLFAVGFALPLIWAVVKRRGLLTWALAVMYLAIGMVFLLRERTSCETLEQKKCWLFQIKTETIGAPAQTFGKLLEARELEFQEEAQLKLR